MSSVQTVRKNSYIICPNTICFIFHLFFIIFLGTLVFYYKITTNKMVIHYSILQKSFNICQSVQSVQLLSLIWLFAAPWIAARWASLSTTNAQSSLKLTSIESVMPSSHLILRRPLFLLPPIPPSIRVFFNESTLCIEVAQVLEFQL